MDSPLWPLEDSLWTGGPAAYRRLMHPMCLMAFPGAGLMMGEDILAAVEAAPRWREVAIEGRRLAETDGMAVLGYLATALRDSGDPWRVCCTSTWVQRGTDWQIVQHQQTPLG
ncbi:nuclear transport factor 2 family protein [Frigidibacter oleivorans]|uniref:nuclear transport factor 2 family protein n=1 Tax=Frigidibacter oleivorans TaxID=2487129 RepID=UPI0013DEECF3|nr:nuclear transport factor 2 family protein [Frigidibacter oleivorans]